MFLKFRAKNLCRFKSRDASQALSSWEARIGFMGHGLLSIFHQPLLRIIASRHDDDHCGSHLSPKMSPSAHSARTRSFSACVPSPRLCTYRHCNRVAPKSLCPELLPSFLFIRTSFPLAASSTAQNPGFAAQPFNTDHPSSRALSLSLNRLGVT